MIRVDDFEQATRLERGSETVWTALLREDWALWGPAGGYISALALRAAGEATAFPRPVSMTCHFLRPGKFAAAELHVERLRAGRRSELLRVDLRQEGKSLLTCSVWTMPDSMPGLVHDATRLEGLPDPETLPAHDALDPEQTTPPFFRRFDQRPLKGMPRSGEASRDPELSGFYRFTPTATASDPFVDAARVLLLLDTFGWLAQYPAHPEEDPSPWVAPNIDYHYRFHRPTRHAEWLHMRVRAPIAEGGLMATDGEIRDAEGYLLATGASQLMCLPRAGQ